MPLNKNLQFLVDNVPKYRIVGLQGGTRCFTGETLVLTDKGYIAISDINQGQKVYSLNKHGNIELRSVLKKYLYEAVQPSKKMLTFGLVNGTKIKSTYGHEFFQSGIWVDNSIIAKRAMEGSGINQKQILDFINGKASYYWLQREQKSNFNETSNFGWLCKNSSQIRYRGIQADKNPSVSRSSVYSELGKQSYGKPQERTKGRQSCGELGMGNAQGEFRPCGIKQFNGFESWGEKRHEYFDRGTGQANKGGVCTIQSNGKRFSGKVWSKDMYYKRCSSNENVEARQISIDEIEYIELSYEQIDVYDLSVDTNHNYIVTTDNIIVHNSGKSYAVVQYLISLATKYNIGVISICRESYNALKATVLRDFIDILISAGLFRDEDYNRTDHTYVLNGNVFEFFGMDSPGKVQGRKRNILFVNEVMETNQSVYRQLALRTENRIIMDFNPTAIEHWVYKELEREDATTVITTYLDNLENLNADTIAEIEYLKDADPDLWKVFGEGMPSAVRNQIYSHQKVAAHQPVTDFCYGLDFGYNHPTALVEVGHIDRSVQWHEIIYQSHLTPSDLIDLMIQKGVRKTIQIYADGARPEAIAEIQKAGFRIKAVEKYPGSVKEQIMKVKSRPLVISSESVNLLREVKSYKWSDNNPDEPIKAFDDGMDAGRYGTHGLIKGKRGNPLISFTT